MTKPSNPSVQPKTWLHEVMDKVPVYEGARGRCFYGSRHIEEVDTGGLIAKGAMLRAIVPSLNDAKATLQMAQWSLRAYRIALGAAERRPDSPDWFLHDCRFSVARYEHRVCEALDRLWLAQENANV